MQKQLEAISSAQKNLSENHQTEKERINVLNEELSKRKIEITVYQTKLELLDADIENKNEEIVYLKNEISKINEEKEDVVKEMTHLENQIEHQRIINEQNLNELKILNEHLQVREINFILFYFFELFFFNFEFSDLFQFMMFIFKKKFD